MQAVVEYVGDGRLLGVADSKQPIIMGWRGVGIMPMEAVLTALGGCSAVDIVEIIMKSRKQVNGLRVELKAERVEEPPRVFSKIEITYILKSPDATENELKRAVELSMEKYCSVAAMLRKGGVEISYTFKLER